MSLTYFHRKIFQPPAFIRATPLIKFYAFQGETWKKLVLLLSYPNNERYVWQDSEKYLFAVILIRAFSLVLVVAQLAQTSDPPLIPSPRLFHLEEFSNPPTY